MDSTPPTPPSTDPYERARRKGKTYALGLFLLFAATFVVASTLQLARAVFRDPATKLSSAATLGPGLGCAQQLRSLASAVDRATARALRQSEAAQASADFETALFPEWGAEGVARLRCAAEPHGTEAFAAVLRLRRAAETFARREARALAPLRRDVSGYLSP